MDPNKKLLIYFEPSPENMPGVISITLTFSRMNKENNTYKQKLILQYLNDKGLPEKCKIKEFHVGADKVLEKIEKIDFEAKYDEPSNDENAETFMIKLDDKIIYTSDRKALSEILQLFNFEEITNIPKEHYKHITNLYEYLELMRILKNERKSLTPEYNKILNRILENNPYDAFYRISYLEKYLNRFV